MALNWVWNYTGMKNVLVDTNIILWTFSGGPDFREAILESIPGAKIAIPTCVIAELEKIDTKEAKAALKLCQKIEITNIGDGYADDMLVEAAKGGDIIATNDKDLLNKLKILEINA